jgi:membrane associated rhomboid family serine protease
MHLLWNMLALWMFGIQIERLWGTAKFLRFYFICGISAGLAVILGAYLFGGIETPTVGASGAIYGLLAAYAVLFPDQTILFGFLIPIKSKYFVMIIGAIVFLQSYWAAVGGRGGNVAVIAHLGGLVVGYLLLRGSVFAGSCSGLLKPATKTGNCGARNENLKSTCVRRIPITIAG